jgi:hypothetical protein
LAGYVKLVGRELGPPLSVRFLDSVRHGYQID